MGTTGVDVAAGVPDWGGDWVPQKFAGDFLVEYYTGAIVPAISNTRYEGEIKKSGQSVTVPILPTPTIFDYVKGQGLPKEILTPDSTTLYINQAKAFNYAVNDVDMAQTHIGSFTADLARHYANTMRDTVDAAILEDIVSDCSSDNRGTTAGVKSESYDMGADDTPIVFTASNAIEKIVEAGAVLDEQNVPSEGRSIVMPAWAIAKIKQSDIKDASMTGDGRSVLRNGRVGIIDRFTVYMSNNVYKDADDDWYCIFCHKDALTFAAQLSENEKIKNTEDFGDLYRALMVYGYKVIKTEAMGELVIATS